MKNNAVKIAIIGIISLLLISGINPISSKNISFNIDYSEITEFSNENDTTPPIVKLVKPDKELYINNKAIRGLSTPTIIGGIDVIAEVSDNESGIKMVNFYIDGQLRDTVYDPPYKWTWNEKKFLGHNVKIEAYDNNNNRAEDSDSVFIFNFFPQTKFVTIKGQVIGGLFNTSIPGVKVTVQSDSFKRVTFTKRIPLINRGCFVLRLPPGDYLLTLEKNRFVTQQNDIRVFMDDNEYLIFELEKA
ncbi:MAG: hypothetical protein JSW06_10435 [Thermoplasmatales archaeon]|nr:MAG: hypothetical protein JSW06_10435 [Thermoplasmatales archaeon]